MTICLKVLRKTVNFLLYMALSGVYVLVAFLMLWAANEFFENGDQILGFSCCVAFTGFTLATIESLQKAVNQLTGK